MNSHPMIQPTDWSAESEPDIAGKNMPTNRAAIYRIIWDSAIACCLRAPVLHHHRHIYTVGGGIFAAVATTIPISGHESYWQDRTDHPRLSWPSNRGAQPPQGALRVTGTHAYDASSPTPGEMIEALADAGIATPSSLAGMFATLLGEDRPALVSFHPDRLRPAARITEHGRSCLATWREAGLLGQAHTRNHAVSRIADRQIGHRHGMSEIAGDNARLQDLANTVARQIDTIADTWRGYSHHDASLAKAAIDNPVPVRQALPAWLDPEEILPPDHPLRALRITMESELAVAWPEWTIMAEQDRARLRLEWLSSRQKEIADPEVLRLLASALDERSGPFSALRYWLTGVIDPP